MNLETKITIYKFTPQLFTLTPFSQFLRPLGFMAAERLNRLKSHVNPFCTRNFHVCRRGDG